MTSEGWSDLSGLISGVALLITAVRNDGLYVFVDKLRTAVETTRKQAAEAAQSADTSKPKPPPDKLAEPITKALEAELTKWSWIDRWSLRVGAFFLLLSYGIKVFG